MTSSSFSSAVIARAEEAFHHALALDEPDRGRFLDTLDQNDPPAAAFARALVAADLEFPIASDETLIGPYRIVRSLGRGGTARVFLAARDDCEFHQVVAIKLLDAPFRADYFAERFRHERQILNSLNHPNIARLFDWGISSNGAFYIVMEYVDGLPLDQFVALSGFNPNQILALFRTVAVAVQAAHRGSIVHRDLKPANILVTSEGVVKLLDFGTAKQAVEAVSGVTTELGFRAFTPQYASPEQVAGRPLTTATDIYSLAVILYRLLTGHPPYEAADLDTEQLIETIVIQPHAPPRIDRDMDAILDKALRKDPNARQRSVEELIRDLDCYRDGCAVPARRGGRWYRAQKFARRHRVPLAFLAVLLIVVLAAVAALLWQAEKVRERDADLRRLTASLMEEIYARVGELPGSTETQQVLIGHALRQLDKFAKQASSDLWVRRQLANAYIETGNLQGSPYQQNLGQVQAGLASFQKALGLIQSILIQNPADHETLSLKARALSSEAALQLISGSGNLAVNTSRAAADLYDQVNQPRTADGDLAAAAAWTSYGDMLGQVGVSTMAAYDQALQAYRRAEYIAASSHAGHAESKRSRELAIVNIKIADLIREGFPKQAETRYEKALQSLNSVAEQAAISTQRIRLLAECKLAADMGELSDSGALGHAMRGLELARALAAISPADPQALLDLAVARVSVAEVDFAMHDYSHASGEYAQVCALGKRLVATNPGGNLYSRVVSEGSVMRDLSEALTGNRDAASRLSSDLDPIVRTASAPDASVSDVRLALSVLTQPVLPIPRRPAIAIALAERAAKETHELRPAVLCQLASAYNSAGDRKRAASVAAQAIKMIAADPSALRQRLEKLAQLHSQKN